MGAIYVNYNSTEQIEDNGAPCSVAHQLFTNLKWKTDIVSKSSNAI